MKHNQQTALLPWNMDLKARRPTTPKHIGIKVPAYGTLCMENLIQGKREQNQIV
jgi:hypothetical protein